MLPLRRDRASPPGDVPDRILYWCPGCQTRLAPATATPADLPTDQHPAAKAFRADDTPWLNTG